MWLIKRLRDMAPPTLQCPLAPDEYLLYRADGGASGIVQGTSLAVCPREYAMLVVDNRIINTLGPGIYRLDRHQLSDLEAIYSWPANYAGPIGAEVVFVSMHPMRRFVWEWRPAGIPADSPFEASGTLDFSVTDAGRFAAYHIEHRVADDAAVRQILELTVASELRALLTEPSSDALALQRSPRDAARALRKRLRTVMESRGIGEYSVRIRFLRHVDAASPPAAVEATGETEVTGNVTPLPLDAIAQDTGNAGGIEQGDDRELDEMAVIDELEREIERLDAWSSISRTNGAPDSPATNPDTESEKVAPTAVVPAPPLPESLNGLNFYIAVDMEQTGPFDADEFAEAIRDGVVQARTLVWFKGIDDWTPAGEIPQLAPLL